MTSTALPSLAQLAATARAVNHANGWSTTFEDRDVPTALALIHSEITEAYLESTRQARARELGDVIVRAMDLAELISPGALGELWRETPLNSLPATPVPDDWEATLLMLHAQTSSMLEHYRKAPEWKLLVVMELSALISLCCGAMHRQWVFDPAVVVSEIIEANRQRGYRHGGRRT